MHYQLPAARTDPVRLPTTAIDPAASATAAPLNELPLHLSNPGSMAPDLLKLEAPLAVQGRPPLPGSFPINKFSSVPLLMEASRVAQLRSGGDDVKKRLMIVSDVHVTRLVTAQKNGSTVVTDVLLKQFGAEQSVPVPENGVVILALGTIENARLARTSFPNLPNTNLIGENLMAHLRSNLTIRIPRAALPSGLPAALASSALFVKGKFKHGPNDFSYFHLQITASGLDRPSTDSEAELFKKIPEVELIDALRLSNDDNVVITIRGIGQMMPLNPGSKVTLSGELDEHNMPRAFVDITPSSRDQDLWNAMDEAADDVALVFANGQPYELFEPPQAPVKIIHKVGANVVPSTILPVIKRRDPLGTTHHEAGTLRMGTNANASVTNSDCRFHHVANTYVVGPALFPTIGSPNPMLTGTALAQRLGDHFVVPPPQADAGFTLLFDGMSPSVDERVRVVGNGIEDVALLPRASSRDSKAPLVLFNGRFVERKGIRELMEAIGIVLGEAPEVRFVLAGGHRGCSGAQMESWLLPAQLRQFRAQIHFTGWLTPGQLTKWYRRADILVVPSWYEPFGMVILEGMLHGVAIAASAVGGPSEILDLGYSDIISDLFLLSPSQRQPAVAPPCKRSKLRRPRHMLRPLRKGRTPRPDLQKREPLDQSISPHNSKGLGETDPEHPRGRIPARIVYGARRRQDAFAKLRGELIRPIEGVRNRRMRYAHNLCDVLQSTASPQRWFHLCTTSTLRRNSKHHVRRH